MSRNGSGIYSLPAGNPVTTGTVISSTWANTTLSDISNALTQSVSADGQTPITGALVGLNGTVSFGGTGQVALPSGTIAQRSGTPVNGMIRYNSDIGQFEGYAAGAWGGIGGGATGGGSDEVFVENSLTVTTSYSIPSGKSASSVGPISIAGGATITIPSGSKWVIL
jgi:hypothetical protein